MFGGKKTARGGSSGPASVTTIRKAKTHRKSVSNYEIDATKKTEAQIEEDVGLIASIIGVRFGVPVEFVEVRGDMDKALYRLALQPWAHFQTGTLPTPAEQRQ